ncbi:MAG: thermonuclease family protein [Anaerolineae bacterium]|nr:thermonuclease family protein [Anaerolineae bacterium]
MPDVKTFWDPQGLTVDSLGSKEYLRTTDGDTPYVSLSIRMLSIDAPEVHYPGRTRPSRHDADLAQLAQWIIEGHAPIDGDLAAYLQPRLATGKAGTLQEHQGQQSSAVFQQMLEKMLERPTGSRRSLFIRTADQPFDEYGRLLAYIAPSYSSDEMASLSEWQRATFNLLMVQAGWAATLIIYPSLPKYQDLVMLQEAAKEAYLSGRGIWAESLVLTGYEFRMAIKLFEITRKLVNGDKVSSSQLKSWISRYCVDMTTKEIYYPEKYFQVAPYNRLFIWPKDVSEAVGKLNLAPAD